MLVPSIFADNFMDEMFRDVFKTRRQWNRGFLPEAKGLAMNTDIKELDDHYEMHLELPGYKKEEIQAELTDGYLTISASHSDTKEEKDEEGKYIRRERYAGSSQRSFYVGEAVQQEDIKANFTDGVLKLIVPKKEAKEEIPQKQYIAIEG